MTRKVYIAGQMRGLPDWNRAAFDEAEDRWTDAGWLVFSPAHAVRLMGTDPAGPEGSVQDRTHLNQAMQIDLACLYAADAIALLPGWEKSAGATIELAMAQFLGLEVYDAPSLLPMAPPMIPWKVGPYREWMHGPGADLNTEVEEYESRDFALRW